MVTVLSVGGSIVAPDNRIRFQRFGRLYEYCEDASRKLISGGTAATGLVLPTGILRGFPAASDEQPTDQHHGDAAERSFKAVFADPASLMSFTILPR